MGKQRRGGADRQGKGEGDEEAGRRAGRFIEEAQEQERARSSARRVDH